MATCAIRGSVCAGAEASPTGDNATTPADGGIPDGTPGIERSISGSEDGAGDDGVMALELTEAGGTSGATLPEAAVDTALADNSDCDGKFVTIASQRSDNPTVVNAPAAMRFPASCCAIDDFS